MTQSSGIWRLVLLPSVVVTWAVILVRLGGELVGGPAWLFSRDAGGGGAIVGIAWLVFVFGAYHGWRLAKTGRGPDRPGRAALLHVAALAAGIGGMFGLGAAGIINMEGDPNPNTAYWIGSVLGAASLLMLWAWPALFQANLAYAFLARLGVIAVTIPATLGGWDTHFSKAGKAGLQEQTWDHVMTLSTAQVCFWIPFTILGAGLFGSVAALFAGGRGSATASVQPDQSSAAEVIGGGDVQLP